MTLGAVSHRTVTKPLCTVTKQDETLVMAKEKQHVTEWKSKFKCPTNLDGVE